MTDEVARRIGPDRRTFVKRLVVGTVFAAPLVQSFSMSGIEAVFGSGAGATTLMGDSNTGSPPPAPTNFSQMQCFQHPNAGASLKVTDSALGVTLNLTLPNFPSTLPAGTIICFYKGDLNALAALFPAGQTPLSAYAVLWDGPPTNASPTANPAVHLTVSGAAVDAGNPIYDISSGTPVSIGAATSGNWSASFANDPLYVVTAPVPTETPPAPPTPPASSSTAPAAVAASPKTTG